MNLKKNILALSVLLLPWLPLNSYSFSCYITLVKNDCWNDYNIDVRMIDVENEKEIADLSIQQDATVSWMREPFECTPKQTFRFEAQFNPPIWENSVQTYKGKRYWSLPASTENAAAWGITLCFPDDFSSVPLPPTASKCRCDKSVASQITPPEKSS